MKTLVLIDGNYWLFSSYYATAAMGNLMMNKDGIPTNAIFGFANRLESVLSSSPDALMVAFDAKGKTFRSELQEDYKGTRKETPIELKTQFPICREFLDAHNIPYYEKEGYEGDDIIGTLARIGEAQGYEVHILTGDKDMMQLVTDQVHVYKRNTKTKSDDIITPVTFKEKYGLVPDQMRDLLGLMGDTADNIPGIKGVGEKTALKLLSQYGSLEEIDIHKEEISGKLGEKIRENIETGKLSKEIATILTDVPLDKTLEDFSLRNYDFDTLKSFYQKYDMNSLIKRMTLSTSSQKKEKEVLTYEIVKTLPEINKDTAIYSCIYDTNYHKSINLGYAFYNDAQAYFIDFMDAINDASFKNYMKDETLKKYTYNIKAQYLNALWNGIEINGLNFDLQLASYALNPSLKDDLKSVCDYYDYEDVYYQEEIFDKGAKKHIPNIEEIAKYAVSNAKAIFKLKDTAISKLKEEDQYDLYQEVELPITHILSEMEYQGAKVDVSVLKELEDTFNTEIKGIETSIYELAGETFNIASPKQLGEILFVKLGLKNGKKTKTGYSTSQDILEKIEDDHPIVPLVLRYRTLTKLMSTYVVGLQDALFPDGKIHTIYNQALTQTGRLSSIEPNLQNIPVRSEDGKLIRKAFVPSFDYLISFDYSQIELRILAHSAEVKELIKAFNENKDIHRHTAALVYQISDEEVTSSQRSSAKAVNFGIIYGMSEFRLSKQIHVSIQEAKDFIKRYYDQYPEITEYMNKVVEDCKKDGYVSTLLNRKRYIPTINDSNFMVREQAKRFAMNTPIQGSGADILKLAMIKVYNRMKKENLESKMILQVHDELIFDVKKEEVDVLMKLIKEEMEHAVSLKVPLIVEGNYATNWYDLK